jgi:hypothetical protein
MQSCMNTLSMVSIYYSRTMLPRSQTNLPHMCLKLPMNQYSKTRSLLLRSPFLVLMPRMVPSLMILLDSNDYQTDHLRAKPETSPTSPPHQYDTRTAAKMKIKKNVQWSHSTESSRRENHSRCTSAQYADEIYLACYADWSQHKNDTTTMISYRIRLYLFIQRPYL